MGSAFFLIVTDGSSSGLGAMLFASYGLLGVATITAILIATIAMKVGEMAKKQDEILEALKNKG